MQIVKSMKFFENNVYIIVLDQYAPYLANYTIDCLENITDEEGQLCGKRLKVVFGSLEDYGKYADAIMNNLYAGIIIPRKDLEGVGLAEVVVD